MVNIFSRLTFSGPYPTPNAEDPLIFEKDVDVLLDHIKEVYLKFGEIVPTAFIFVTRNVLTNDPLDMTEMGVIGMMGGFTSKSDKEEWIRIVTEVAHRGRAVAIVTAAQAYAAQLESREEALKEFKKGSTPVSELPNRKEVLMITVEHSSDISKSRMLMAEVQDSSGGLSIGEFESMQSSNGLFSGLLAASRAFDQKVGIA